MGLLVKCMFPVLATGSVIMHGTSPVLNESSRRFYEDESVTGSTTVEGSSTLDGTDKIDTTIVDTAETVSPQRIVNGVMVSSPSKIESAFKYIRENVYSGYSQLSDYANKGYNKLYAEERKVTNTVSQLHDKSEDLFPNSIYVFIAAMSGTIMARQRSVLARMSFPVILGLGSFKYFLPNTFTSTANFVWGLEQQKLPEIAKHQQALVTKSGELVTKLENATESSQKSVDSSLLSLKKGIKKYTGLNLDDDVTKK